MAAANFASLARYIQSMAPSEPDSALLARFARQADEPAFAEIVRRHGPAVLGVSQRVLRDSHAAEDAFQATFLLLARKAGSLRDPQRLGCWLYGVAYRTALKLRGRMTLRQTREQPLDEADIASPDQGDAEVGPELDAAIQQLPSKYRVPVVLCYLQGMTNAEAAAALGCPANTVATRLARARDRLRGRLTKEGVTAAVSATLLAVTSRNAAALVEGSAGASVEIVTLMEGVRTAMLWDKVKIVAATLAVLTLTGFGVSKLSFRATADQPAASSPQAPALGKAHPPSVTPDLPPPTAALDASSQRLPAIDVTAPPTSSKNFVVTGASPEICNRIMIAAEEHRARLASLWFGNCRLGPSPAPSRSISTRLGARLRRSTLAMTSLSPCR